MGQSQWPERRPGGGSCRESDLHILQGDAKICELQLQHNLRAIRRGGRPAANLPRFGLKKTDEKKMVKQIQRFRKGQCRGVDSWNLPICSHYFKWSHVYCSEPSGLHPLIDARLPKTTGRSACPRTKSSSSQCFIWDQEHSGLVTQWLARLGKRTLARSLRCCSCTSQVLPDLGLPEYHEIEHVSGPRTFFAKCHRLDRFAGNWAPSCHFTRGTGALAR